MLQLCVGRSAREFQHSPPAPARGPAAVALRMLPLRDYRAASLVRQSRPCWMALSSTVLCPESCIHCIRQGASSAFVLRNSAELLSLQFSELRLAAAGRLAHPRGFVLRDSLLSQPHSCARYMASHACMLGVSCANKSHKLVMCGFAFQARFVTHLI